MHSAKKTKIVYSPSNLDHYERLYKAEHDAAMGYSYPIYPRTIDIVERMNRAYPVPSPIHVPFRRWMESNQLARFDCFLPSSWNCTCYKCVTFQVQSERDVVLFEQIKDEKERGDVLVDNRSAMTTDRLLVLGFSPGHNESDILLFEGIKEAKELDEIGTDERGVLALDRLQMLCDVAARSAAIAIPNEVVPTTIQTEPLNVCVNNICHFFPSLT